MKKSLIFVFLIIFGSVFSQEARSTDLSIFTLCELSFEELVKLAPDLKKVNLEEMNLCSDGFINDGRFENRVGYETEVFPCVIFQKLSENENLISKIHLKECFKGKLLDGNYVDLTSNNAEDLILMYEDLTKWNSRGCSDYWGLNRNEELYFYIKIDKSKEPRYPIDQEFYKRQPISGADIIFNCFLKGKEKKEKAKPLYFIDGVESTEEEVRKISPDDVDTIIVLKDQSAKDLYGDKGVNGVIQINMKKDKDKNKKKKKK